MFTGSIVKHWETVDRVAEAFVDFSCLLWARVFYHLRSKELGKHGWPPRAVLLLRIFSIKEALVLWLTD